MPQLIFFAVVGVAAYAGYKALKREAAKVIARGQRSQHERETGTTGTLVRDPETGEYRLAKD